MDKENVYIQAYCLACVYYLAYMHTNVLLLWFPLAVYLANSARVNFDLPHWCRVGCKVRHLAHK